MQLAIFFVYIVHCRNNSYYTGQTNCISRRMRQHQGFLPGGSKYVLRHGFNKLVYFEIHTSRHSALTREHEIKHWHEVAGFSSTFEANNTARSYKEYLVRNMPNWKLNLTDHYKESRRLLQAIEELESNAFNDFIPLFPEVWNTQRKNLEAQACSSVRPASQTYQQQTENRTYQTSDDTPKEGGEGCGCAVIAFIVFVLYQFSN